MFSDDEALAAAQLAGAGGPGLAPCPDPPVLSPGTCNDALQYLNTLPEDGRHALFKHCALVARHERLLLEGQERLKYVQAQIREMKAQMPPPPPPKPVRSLKEGPEVTADPVRSPSCWASCCGLIPLPPPPAPPPPPPGPLVVRLPNDAYFREEAAKRHAAARRDAERQRRRSEEEDALGGGGSAPEPTAVVAASASVGGASEAGGAGGPPAEVVEAAAAVVVAAELPGQLDAAAGMAVAAETVAAETVVTGPAAGAVAAPPQAPPAVQPPPPPPPPLAPLRGKAPMTPQSLLRPLAPLQPLGGAATASGPSEPSKGRGALPPLRGSPPGLDPTAAVGPEGGAAVQSAAAAGPAPAPVDFSSYQDPETVRKITRIQAAQRGRMARKHVAAMRAEQQSQQQPRGSDRGKNESADSGGGRGAPAKATAKATALPTVELRPHPFADPTQGAKLPPLPGLGPVGGKAHTGGGGAAVGGGGGDAGGGDAEGGGHPQHDLSRYQDPETLRKITRIQAAQRGRMARKQVAAMRAEQQSQRQQIQHDVVEDAGSL